MGFACQEEDPSWANLHLQVEVSVVRAGSSVQKRRSSTHSRDYIGSLVRPLGPLFVDRGNNFCWIFRLKWVDSCQTPKVSETRPSQFKFSLLEWLMKRGFRKMPLWSLHRDDSILWRLSLSLLSKISKIIFVWDNSVSYSSTGSLSLVTMKRETTDDPSKYGRTPWVSQRLPEWTNPGKDLRDEKLLFSEKGQMLSKRYEPHCPSRTCTGGHKNRLYRIRGNPNWLPREIWAKKKEEQSLCRCVYCGLAWFQENSKRLGLDARPVGYYDDFEHPWEFVSLKPRYRIREKNTSRYWYSMGRKAIRAPRCGGVDWPSGRGRRWGRMKSFLETEMLLQLYHEVRWAQASDVRTKNRG